MKQPRARTLGACDGRESGERALSNILYALETHWILHVVPEE